jgi:hypothetical protein
MPHFLEQNIHQPGSIVMAVDARNDHLLCQLKANRLLGLVLNHHGAKYGMMSLHHIADLQPDQVAAKQLDVDSQEAF